MFENQEVSIPDTINGYIRSTAAWSRFLSILGFVSVGIMLLASLIVTASLFLVQGKFGNGNNLPPFIGLIYIPMSVLYLIPAIYVFKYSSALKKILAGPASLQAVEEAVRYQKSFWKFVGILAIVSLVLGFIASFAMIMLGVMKAMGRI